VGIAPLTFKKVNGTLTPREPQLLVGLRRELAAINAKLSAPKRPRQRPSRPGRVRGGSWADRASGRAFRPMTDQPRHMISGSDLDAGPVDADLRSRPAAANADHSHRRFSRFGLDAGDTNARVGL